MSSEIITRNDLKAIFDEIIPPTIPATNVSATDEGGNESDVQTILNKLQSSRTVYFASSSNTISSTSIDTNTNGAHITLPADGKHYLIIGWWSFNSRSSSGTTNSQVAIRAGASGSIIASQRIFASGSNWNALQCFYITDKMTTQTTYYVCGSTSRAYTSASTNWIRAIALD